MCEILISQVRHAYTYSVYLHRSCSLCSLTLNEGEDIVYGAKWTPQSPFTSVFMYISENPEYEKETVTYVRSPLRIKKGEPEKVTVTIPVIEELKRRTENAKSKFD